MRTITNPSTVPAEARPTAATAPPADTRRPRHREIRTWGTAARIAVGVWMLASVVAGHWADTFNPASWTLGLVVFPALALAWQWARARRNPAPLQATGPLGHTLNMAIGAALWATPWYAPSLAFTSDAALLFYGTSMLLAAARGYGGCEVTAVSNWLLRRNDQVGCVLFSPIDAVEASR